ncbi:MAG TPA: DUF5682 family protein [Myxococcota bacterium]
MQRGRLHVIGVRHHSPACAHLVAHTIRALRPKVVLIEGPADMNGRLDELLLPHTLPVAVFSFSRATSADGVEHREHASFSPLGRFSPEWQALTVGTDVGADVRFMDLPAWDKAFAGVVNRYSDGSRRHLAAVDRLCAHFHIDGYDALWDHLFEDDLAHDASDADFTALQHRLDAYFVALRNDESGDSRDGPREALMRDFIRAALGSTGADDVVLAVCGGFHAPMLLSAAGDSAVNDRDASPMRRVPWPVIDQPEGAESYLVPWSFKRLDAFSGYAAGMPSPGFYDDVFALGAGAAVDNALWGIVRALRARNLAVSSADVIAAQTLAEGLGRLRGHAVLRRTDLLDGVAAALVKEPLDAPLPWATRGDLRRDTDALLVHVLKVLSGHQTGRLADGTPLPPLVDDVDAVLKELKLAPVPDGPARTEKLRLVQPADLDKSRVLHRLRVLGVPGFSRTKGPRPGVDTDVLEEQWVIADHPDRLAAVIEAAAWGATLTTATSARLEMLLAAADLDLSGVARVLGEAVLVGLDALTAQALRAVRSASSRESDFSRLGAALSTLSGLFTHDALFGARHRPELRVAVDEVYQRGLWLLEQLTGPSSPADGTLVAAVVALRDVARARATDVDVSALVDLVARQVDNEQVPPAIRGAALGTMWSLGCFTSEDEYVGDTLALRDDGAATAIRAVRKMAQPEVVGDFLAGLFALARAEVVAVEGGEHDVLAVIDEVVAGMPEHDFLVAVPALRLAFSFFPPREKVVVAEKIATRHGKQGQGRSLLKLATTVDATIAGRAVDDAVHDVLVRYGLLPESATAATEQP